jgi:vanillate O-demethylase ferredoxin subunit
MTSAQTLRVRVAKRQASGQDIALFTLVSADGAQLPAFEAGSHIDVHLPGGLVRQYSLCSDPADANGPAAHYRIGVLRDANSRGGSVAVHEHLKEGVELVISAPRNHFPLITGAGAGKAYLFGGGIGVTPMIAMAQTLHKTGMDFEFHYSSRSPAHMAFTAELDAAPFAARIHKHFDENAPQPAQQRADAAAILGAAPPGAHVYVCGPKGYMDWVMNTAREQGFPSERIHYEFFQVDVQKGGASFTVVAQASGKEVIVEAEESIANALERIGIRVQVSCEQGICGTCLTNVIEGTPDHRDEYQTDEEKAANEQITICCSRSLTPRLVLDL